MDRTTFSLEIFGDRLPWYGRPDSAGDNTKQIMRMKTSLNNAIESELTDRQKQILRAFYFEGYTVTEISERYGINKSTVSRHLKRSREKLHQVLKYGLYPIWNDR